MTDTKWGKALTGLEMKALGLPAHVNFYEMGFGRRETPHEFWWGTFYRIPADHPAYTVHETNKRTGSRFVFHAGGPQPSGEVVRVLFGDGETAGGDGWTWEWSKLGFESNHIIGYELAVDVSETPVDDHQSDLMSADDTQTDTVTINCMTEAEAREWINDKWDANESMSILRNLGLIREETREEHFTRETGHAVTDAVAAALDWGR